MIGEIKDELINKIRTNIKQREGSSIFFIVIIIIVYFEEGLWRVVTD